MWRTRQDFEEDLIKFSEFNRPLKGKKAETPFTIIEYQKRMEENCTSPNRRNNNINENLTYIASGRGRGIEDRIIKPGHAVKHHPLDDVELKKNIREVAGLGYSNELIEKSIKAKTEMRPKEVQTTSLEFEHFQWVPKQKFVNSHSSSADDLSNASTSTSDNIPMKYNKIKKQKCDEVIVIND